MDRLSKLVVPSSSPRDEKRAELRERSEPAEGGGGAVAKRAAGARPPFLVAVLSSSLACLGCPSGLKDPLPREETTELASAAPRALGALAAGTDAAPPVVAAPRLSEEIEGYPIPELEADGGLDEADASVESDELPL